MNHSRSYSGSLSPTSPHTPQFEHITTLIHSGNNVRSSHRKSSSWTAFPSSRSPSRRREYCNELLAKDISEYRGKDKLYEMCEALQVIGREQREEIAKLREQALASLGKSPSTPSVRRDTHDSDDSKKTLASTKKGIAVAYNHSTNELFVLQRKDMDDSHYIKADLPGFHFWNDVLHIYFEKSQDGQLTANGRREVIVLKKKLDNCTEKNLTFIRTVKLGKLGVGIKLRRIIGGLKTIYVHSAQQQHSKSTEKTASMDRTPSRRA